MTSRGTNVSNTPTINWGKWFVEKRKEDIDMSNGPENTDISECFTSSLNWLMTHRNTPSFRVSNENFFIADPTRPNDYVSPDVYLTIPAPDEPLPKVFRTWEQGNPIPLFVLEVVSQDTMAKDYDTNPALYGTLGVQEYCIFDADIAAVRLLPRTRSVGIKRSPITLFRRRAGRRFTSPVYQGQGPVYCESLGVWLRSERNGRAIRLRMSFDEAGEQLVPTHDEARELAENIARIERAEKEYERAQKDAALKELAELRAKLGLG